MPDAPQFHVVRVPDVEAQGIAEGPFAVVWPEPTDAPGERYLLVPLGDLPAPGEMGEAKSGAQFDCHIVSVNDTGKVRAYTFGGISLTRRAPRRAPPEPTWQEALETVKRVWTEDYPHVSELRTAIEIIEKRLAGRET